jgi:hypothetical protein
MTKTFSGALFVLTLLATPSVFAAQVVCEAKQKGVEKPIFTQAAYLEQGFDAYYGQISAEIPGTDTSFQFLYTTEASRLYVSSGDVNSSAEATMFEGQFLEASVDYKTFVNCRIEATPGSSINERWLASMTAWNDKISSTLAFIRDTKTEGQRCFSIGLLDQPQHDLLGHANAFFGRNDRMARPEIVTLAKELTAGIIEISAYCGASAQGQANGVPPQNVKLLREAIAKVLDTTSKLKPLLAPKQQ